MLNPILDGLKIYHYIESGILYQSGFLTDGQIDLIQRIFKNLISIINSSPSTHIRFDSNRINKEEVMHNLSKNNIITEIIGTLDNFLKVKTGISRLLSCQLFSDGLISIQDPAAGGCVELLNPMQGEIILDVCASPGTKTLMIAEKMKGNGFIFASDISLERINYGRKDISRHGYTNIKWIKQKC